MVSCMLQSIRLVEVELFIVISATPQVYPVAAAVPRARDAGVRLLIINAEPTQFDEVADAVVRVPIGEVLPRLCEAAM
jgi:NAD-dependent deacetylase